MKKIYKVENYHKIFTVKQVVKCVKLLLFFSSLVQ